MSEKCPVPILYAMTPMTGERSRWITGKTAYCVDHRGHCWTCFKQQALMYSVQRAIFEIDTEFIRLTSGLHCIILFVVGV